MSTPHINDFGTTFRITLTDANGDAVDISTATIKQIWFKKPDGTVLSKDAVFLTDGTDGIIQWVATAGVLILKGLWEIQGRVSAVAFQYSSVKGSFILEPIIIS